MTEFVVRIAPPKWMKSALFIADFDEILCIDKSTFTAYLNKRCCMNFEPSDNVCTEQLKTVYIIVQSIYRSIHQQIKI